MKIKKESEMRFIILLIGVVYLPLVNNLADMRLSESQIEMIAWSLSIGFIYATTYDYLHYKKGKK